MNPHAIVSRIKVCTPERMCFYINAETLQPETISVYDAWCFTDPDGPTLSYADWMARNAAATGGVVMPFPPAPEQEQ